MTPAIGLPLSNRWAVAWDDVPVAGLEDFRASLVGAVRLGARLVLLFGVPEEDAWTRVVAVLADDSQGRLGVSSARVRETYPALTPDCPSAHVFEREMAEQCGLVPKGHPWLKPLRRHPPDHLADGRTAPAFDREAYPFADKDGAALLWHASFRKPGKEKTVEADGMDLVLLQRGLIQRNEVYFDRVALAPLMQEQ